jgi:MFS family permease
VEVVMAIDSSSQASPLEFANEALPNAAAPPAGAMAGPPHPTWASKVRAPLTVLLLSAMFALAMIDRVVGSILVSPIKRDLHLSDVEFSLTQGVAIALFYILLAGFFGWASDRFGRRPVIFVGIAVWSLASAISGLARGFAEFFASRSMVGAGESALGPGGYPLIAAVVAPSRLGLAVGLFLLGGFLGTGLAFFVGGPLVTWLATIPPVQLWGFGELAPWRMVFLVTGLPGLLLAPLIFLAREGGARPAGGAGKKADRTAASPVFWHYLRCHRRFYLCHNLGIGLQQAALFGALLWTAAFFERVHHWPANRTGLVMGGAVMVASALGLFGHGWVVSRLFVRGRRDGHLRWQIAMSVIALPLALGTYLSGNAYVTAGGFGLLFFCLISTMVAGPSSLQLATPAALRGRASALYVVVATALGTAVGPVVIASLTDYGFHDERAIGMSIIITVLAANLLAIWSLVQGLAAMRRAVADASATRMVHA